MITRRRLDRLEATFNHAPEHSSPDRDLKRAKAAAAARTWSWDDARLLLGGRAAECRQWLAEHARVLCDDSAWPYRDFPEHPMFWAMQIVTCRPDEVVPPELGDKVLGSVLTPDGSGRKPFGEDFSSENYDAVALILAFETPDARRLRTEIWTPEVPAPPSRSQVDAQSHPTQALATKPCTEDERDAALPRSPQE